MKVGGRGSRGVDAVVGHGQRRVDAREQRLGSALEQHRGGALGRAVCVEQRLVRKEWPG
jgi:hypothetical protein